MEGDGGGGSPGENGAGVVREARKEGTESGRNRGEITIPTLRNISPSKKSKQAGAKKRAETRIKGYGKREAGSEKREARSGKREAGSEK